MNSDSIRGSHQPKLCTRALSVQRRSVLVSCAAPEEGGAGFWGTGPLAEGRGELFQSSSVMYPSSLSVCFSRLTTATRCLPWLNGRMKLLQQSGAPPLKSRRTR
jgi:hypothetical protein